MLSSFTGTSRSMAPGEEQVAAVRGARRDGAELGRGDAESRMERADDIAVAEVTQPSVEMRRILTTVCILLGKEPLRARDQTRTRRSEKGEGVKE
jgi:hypothetical protein